MANLIQDYKYSGKQVPMEEVKVLSQSCGTQILAIRSDTFKIFTPGLLENADRIQSIQPVTETYGSHARHKVDIYQSHAHDSTNEPILVFLYAGGLTRGNRTIEAVPNGLVYNNLGTYFASRGLTTIVPDYRRVDGKKGGEGALYPSGGEDVALLLKWLSSSSLVKNGHRDVYLLGNSAGAIHAATFLLDGQFHDERKLYSEGSGGFLQGAKSALGVGQGITIRGAILLGLPSDFAGVSKARKEHSSVYYGNEDKAARFSPLGLLSSITATTSTPTLSHLAIPHLLVLTAEYDPADEIIKPTEAFVHKFHQLFPTSSDAIQYKVLKGHNHISPIAALMSGDELGERWAKELIVWILGTESVKVDQTAEEIMRGPKKKKTEDAAPVNVTEGGKADRSHEEKQEHEKPGVERHEATDLNREGDVGRVGKRETEPKEIDPREHITPRDGA